MNIHKQMEDLGNLGSGSYEASDEVLSHLVAKTRRARTVRQSGAMAAVAVGAMALGLVSMQAVAAFRDTEPAESNIDITIIDDKEKFDAAPVWDKSSEAAPSKIEYLEAAGQENYELQQEKLAELERLAEEEAQRLAEEEEAKRKAEAAKQAEKNDGDKKKDKDKHKWESSCGDWQVDFHGCHDAVSWTDNNGASFKAHKPDGIDKIAIMTGPRSWHWAYNGNEANLDFSAKKCTGITHENVKEHDGKTYNKTYNCKTGHWDYWVAP